MKSLISRQSECVNCTWELASESGQKGERGRKNHRHRELDFDFDFISERKTESEARSSVLVWEREGKLAISGREQLSSNIILSG